MLMLLLQVGFALTAFNSGQFHDHFVKFTISFRLFDKICVSFQHPFDEIGGFFFFYCDLLNKLVIFFYNRFLFLLTDWWKLFFFFMLPFVEIFDICAQLITEIFVIHDLFNEIHNLFLHEWWSNFISCYNKLKKNATC